jgi:hypothetical protein
MKKLSAKDIKRRNEISSTLQNRAKDLETAIIEFNKSVETSWREVEHALADYNSEVEEAEKFREDIYTEQQEYFEEKSENWQQGERGEEYSSWMESWRDAQFSTIEIDEPVELEIPDMDHAQELDSLDEQ